MPLTSSVSTSNACAHRVSSRPKVKCPGGEVARTHGVFDQFLYLAGVGVEHPDAPRSRLADADENVASVAKHERGVVARLAARVGKNFRRPARRADAVDHAPVLGNDRVVRRPAREGAGGDARQFQGLAAFRWYFGQSIGVAKNDPFAVGGIER